MATLFSVLALFTLLFGIGPGHSLLTSLAMPNMNTQMPQGQCQSSCSSQVGTSLLDQKNVEVDNKDLKPHPAEPYYLAFIGVGWTMIVTVAAAYLLKYLRWRPPDLYKLNAVYRI